MVPSSARPIHSGVRIEDAVAAHRAGRLADAESAYRAILAATPRHFDALHLLGVACTQQGRNEEAATLIGKALTLNPKSMDAHYNLGIALSALGRHRQAVASYRRAAALNPRHALVQNNLGIALQELGQNEDAIAALRRAIALDPAFAEAHFNLGRAIAADGRHDDAIAGYRAALALKPDYASAWANIGASLTALARYPEAVECLNAALALQPASVEALSNLGAALSALERHDDAIASLEKALAIDPLFAEAHNNLGNALKAAYRYESAIASYRRAIAVRPDYVEALANLGTVLGPLGHYEEAADQYRRALAIRPGFTQGHSYLLFALDFVPGVTAEEHQAERRRWYERHGRRFASRIEPHANDRDPDRKLRIGYVSADFRRHSAAVAFGAAVAHHDLERFDVVLYSNAATEDEVSRRFQAATSLWRPIRGLSDDAVAEIVRGDRIDILVDLSGHTEGNRLQVFARKPAPVQASGWGHVTGTGLATIDYLLADPVCVPAEHRRFFAETVIDLPCAIAYEAPSYAPDVAPLPAGLGHPLTFGCLNRLSKVSPRSLDLWARLLRETPGARILLKDVQLSDPGERQRIAAAFAARGVEPHRLVLLPATPHVEHLAAYGQVDIALDPFPASGGVSTLEALWMGVPVVALAGTEGCSGRAAATVLTAAGLTDWIAGTEDGYIALARRHGGDLPALTALRASLRSAMAARPVGDPAAYCRAVEEAYRAMWAKYCQG